MRAYKAGDVIVIRYEGPKGGPSMRETLSTTTAIWKYARPLGPAYLGALTRPAAAAETHCYADL